MGDCCNLQLNIRKCDAAKVARIFGCTDIGELGQIYPHKTWIHIEMEEINYGAEDNLQQMNAAEIPFSGAHSNGSGYTGTEFCAIKGIRHTIMSPDNVGPCIEISSNGVNLEQMKEAQAFYDAMILVQAELNGTPPFELVTDINDNTPRFLTAPDLISCLAHMNLDGEKENPNDPDCPAFEITPEDAMSSMTRIIKQARMIVSKNMNNFFSDK